MAIIEVEVEAQITTIDTEDLDRDHLENRVREVEARVSSGSNDMGT